jgi:hypothetical protein
VQSNVGPLSSLAIGVEFHVAEKRLNNTLARRSEPPFSASGLADDPASLTHSALHSSSSPMYSRMTLRSARNARTFW